jgi:hypothetical protein
MSGLDLSIPSTSRLYETCEEDFKSGTCKFKFLEEGVLMKRNNVFGAGFIRLNFTTGGRLNTG